MKLIYEEIKREGYNKPFARVKAYFPEYPEPADMPALINLQIGNKDEVAKNMWLLNYKKGAAEVIREAIRLVDEAYLVERCIRNE